MCELLKKPDNVVLVAIFLEYQSQDIFSLRTSIQLISPCLLSHVTRCYLFEALETITRQNKSEDPASFCKVRG